MSRWLMISAPQTGVSSLPAEIDVGKLMLARPNWSDEDVDRFPLIMELQARPFNMETMLATRRQIKKLRGLHSPLYESIWPMVYVVRMFGFAPYDFSQDRLVPSNGYLIFSAIAASLYSYIIYTIIVRFMGIERDDNVLGGTETTKVNNYSR